MPKNDELINDAIINDAPAPAAAQSTKHAAGPVNPSAPKDDLISDDTSWLTRTTPTTTHTGIPSVKREEDNAVWYGKEHGNTNPKGGWFNEKGEQMGDAPGQPSPNAPKPNWFVKAIAGFGQPAMQSYGQNAPGATQVTPEASKIVGITATEPLQQAGKVYSHVAPRWAGGGPGKQGLGSLIKGKKDMGPVGNLVNRMQQEKADIIASDPSGAAKVLADTTEMAEQIGLAEAIGIPTKLLGAVTPYLIKGPGYLRNIVRGTAAGTSIGGAFGVQKALTTPGGVDQTDTSYSSLPEYALEGIKETAKEGASGTVAGGLLGGAAPALIEPLANLPKAANFIRRFVTGYKGNLPPEITATRNTELGTRVGETVNEALQDAVPATVTGSTITPPNTTPIKDLQLAARGSELDPATLAAKSRVQRVNAAAANEFKVPVTLGDVTQDAAVMAKEAALEAKPGSKLAKFRSEQGQALNQAIADLPENQFNPKALIINPEDDLGAPLVTKLKTLGETNPTARKLADKIELAKTNNEAIQASLEAKHFEKTRESSRLHAHAEEGLEKALNANPTVNREIDLGKVNKEVSDLIDFNSQATYPDASLHNELTQLNPKLNAPYSEVKETVSKLEEAIQRLKDSGNRTAARELEGVKQAYEGAKNDFANKLLEPEYNAKGEFVGAGHADATKTIVEKASDFHRDEVIPYRDKDVGISKIIKGEYADPATKSLFAIDNPKQFKTIFDAMDPRGQEAFKAEILSRANEAGKNGKDLQAWAKYIDKHDEQIAHAFRTDPGQYSKPELLAHLITQTPRAGVGGETPIKSIYSSGHAAKTVLGAAGFAVHGPLGAGLAIGTEMGAELGLSSLAGKLLKVPIKSTPASKTIAPAVLEFLKQSGKPLQDITTLDIPSLNKWMASPENPTFMKYYGPVGEAPKGGWKSDLDREVAARKAKLTVVRSQTELDKLPVGTPYQDTAGNQAIKLMEETQPEMTKAVTPSNVAKPATTETTYLDAKGNKVDKGKG